MKTGNVILDKTIQFSLDVISFTEQLKDDRHFELAHQLFKSATSIGANVHEAQSAESQKDFVHKLKIADKEAKETEYWLILCEKSNHLPSPDKLSNDNEEIRKILGKIISTMKSK